MRDSAVLRQSEIHERQALIRVEDTERIVGLDSKPVLRNLLITQSYHDISQALGQMLGHGNANWCTFATWASKMAGRFIRGEEIPALFRGLLQGSDTFRHGAAKIGDAIADLAPQSSATRELHQGLLDVAERTVDDMSDLIAAGNLKVYAELGPFFARMIAAFKDDRELDREKLERFMKALRKGSTRSGPELAVRRHEALHRGSVRS